VKPRRGNAGTQPGLPDTAISEAVPLRGSLRPKAPAARKRVWEPLPVGPPTVLQMGYRSSAACPPASEVKPCKFRPLVEELVPAPEAEEVFLRLCHLPHCLFLDSALPDPLLGRYSFVAADPFDYLRLPADGTDGLGELARRMAGLRTESMAGLPPFQGGAAGLFSYDLGGSLETLPRPRVDEFQVPALAVGLYDVVVALDHLERRAWIISQGLPELGPPPSPRRRAAGRGVWLACWGRYRRE